MSLRIVKRPKALLDLEEYAIYIGRDNPDAAERFLDQAEQAFRFLSKHPEAGILRREFRNRRLRNMRSWRVPDFGNYLIFYFVHEDRIDIIRIIHGAMDLKRQFL